MLFLFAGMFESRSLSGSGSSGGDGEEDEERRIVSFCFCWFVGERDIHIAILQYRCNNRMQLYTRSIHTKTVEERVIKCTCT